MSESKVPSIDKLYEALESLKKDAGCKINPNVVAKKADVNRTNIYKETDAAKKLLRDIQYASEIRDLEITILALEHKISKLNTDNLKLKKENTKLKSAKAEIKQISSDDGDWMQHLTQMYEMNDSLSSKKADLENQILHGHTAKPMVVDKSTGEVLEGIFNKNQK
jgi:predicted RNase H-like nuclease (RuvC/YqgF family)